MSTTNSLPADVSNEGRRLELHCFPGRPLTAQEQLFLRTARKLYGRDGELEFDDNVVVSTSGRGAYVLGWQWIYYNELVFPQRYHATLYYVDSDGERQLLAKESLMAASVDEVRQTVMAQHWDPRLDSADCRTLCEVAVPVTETFWIEDLNEPDEEFELSQASVDDVVEVLRAMFGAAFVDTPLRIRSESQRAWELRNGELVGVAYTEKELAVSAEPPTEATQFVVAGDLSKMIRKLQEARVSVYPQDDEWYWRMAGDFGGPFKEFVDAVQHAVVAVDQKGTA